MKSAVRILPPQLVDQIAAGEVVERPASVVKELVENSLDAGASSVLCLVEDGGRKLVKVVDDGQGMSPGDLKLAVLRHATSKISDLEDLERIRTLGFRGEALPSIAAVSRMKILTRRAQDQAGTLLLLEGGGEASLSEAGAAVGCDVEVADLFFNTPARRKFLRTQATEMNHIQTWLTRLSLVRSDVHFRLQHGKRTLLEAPGTDDLAQRAAMVLGREVFEHLHQVAYREDDLRIGGLISDPEHSRPNSRAIYLFVNGRFIRDRLLQHAVLEGCQTVLPQGRFPVVVLHVEIDPAQVDVNVHPQKTEVRFLDTQRIHRALAVAVAEVLAAAPWQARSRKTYLLERRPEDGRTDRVREAITRYQASGLGRQTYPMFPDRSQPRQVTQPPETGDAGLSQLRYLGSLWNTYLLLSSPEALLVVDQHAAAERITFERLRNSVEKQQVQIQRLLVPVQIELDGSALNVLEEQSRRIRQVGFEMEPFGPTTVNVTAVPALLDQAPVATLVRDVLDELAELPPASPWEKARLEVIGRMACHASLRAGQKLTETEARALLAQLDQIDFSGTCPHGRPVLVEFQKSGVERWFLRG